MYFLSQIKITDSASNLTHFLPKALDRKQAMKQSGFVIFLTIVLTIYTLVNFYIVRRGLQVLPAVGWAKPIFLTIMLFLILTYPLGRLCERLISKFLGDIFIHIGSYYLAIMLFAFFLIVVIDVLRLVNALVPFIPLSWRENDQDLRNGLFITTTAIVLVLTVVGAINAQHPRLRHLRLQVAKSYANQQLRLVLISDIHLGSIIHNGRMQKLVNLINAQSPEVVLLAGDTFDEDAASISDKNMCAVLRQLRAPLGIYAIPGNHEYYGGIEPIAALLQQSGITMLRDQALKVADSFYIIGREDRTLNQFGGRRQSLDSLVAGLEKTLPMILMDHQPFHLDEAEKHDIDLQVSGHTHHGQIFPFNLITNRIYEVSWGYKQKNNTHIYVSCGAGTWGPPVRIGNTPEIVIIDLILKKK